MKVLVEDVLSGESTVYDSMSSAAIALGTSPGRINDRLTLEFIKLYRGKYRISKF